MQIGIMGGAFKFSEEALQAARIIGKKIAEQGHVLISGATTGIPYAASMAAYSAGGITVGISPAANPDEHVNKYGKPLDGLTAIIYTGMGYNGREPINIASCDGIIYIGGEFGTLIEFGQGFYDGKVLGVLKGVGGISDKVDEILSWMTTDHGAKVYLDDNPEELVEKVIDEVLIKKSAIPK